MRLGRIQQTSKDGLRFTALEFMFWFAMAVGNYQVVYLQTLGFSASTVGLINAAMSAVAIIFTPVWGMLGDRFRSIRSVFLLTVLLGNGLFMLLPNVFGAAMNSVPLMLSFVSLVYLFRTPSSTMLDNWLIRYSTDKGLNYGVIRGMGSIGYTISGLGIAGLIAAKGTTWTFAGCGLCMIPVALIALRTEDSRPAPRSANSGSLNPARLFGNYRFVTFLPFALLLVGTSNCLMLYTPYLLEAAGAAGGLYGVVTAYTAILEVPVLFLAAPLRRKVPLPVLCVACAVVYAATGLLLGLFGSSFMRIMLFMTLKGIGTGLFIASFANYVYSLAPDELKATAQSLYIAATAVGQIGGSLLCGVLADRIGVGPMFVILGLLAAISGLYLTVTLLLGRKIERN